MEDIKSKVNDIVEKVKNDKEFANKFKENPVNAVEQVLGVDLPDHQINEIVNVIKAKLTVSDNPLFGKISKMF